MKWIFFISIFLLQITDQAIAQHLFLNLNNETSQRYESILNSDSIAYHSSVRPQLITNYQVKDSIDNIIAVSNKSANWLFNKPFIGNYKKTNGFVINPILNYTAENSSSTNYLSSAIGISAMAYYGKNLTMVVNGWYNHTEYPEYISNQADSLNIVPHWGAYSGSSKNAYWNKTFTGYLSYCPSKYFNIQAGKDKNFLGDGYRSLFLSDNSSPYSFLKITTSIWKIKYIVMYSAMQDIDSISSKLNLNKKNATLHYLSYNLSKNFNINLFEAVVWSAESNDGYRGYDVNYLNPIIFFRPVENSLSSPDNVFMGGGFKVRILRHNQFYGQLLLDEFSLAEVKANNGWWANKYGFQFGFKSYKLLGMKGVYLLAEYNYARPFTYSHWGASDNYGNTYEPIAHPLGSNFKEMVGILSYNKNRWQISGKLVYSQSGKDTLGVNLGNNIYKPYTSRTNEYGNVMLQGLKVDLTTVELKSSYLINPNYNLRFELGVNIRNYSTIVGSSNQTFIFVGFKTNLYNNNIDYY